MRDASAVGLVAPAGGGLNRKPHSRQRKTSLSWGSFLSSFISRVDEQRRQFKSGFLLKPWKLTQAENKKDGPINFGSSLT